MEYKEFLDLVNIISEEEFKEIQEALPKLDFDINNFEIPYDLSSKVDVADSFIRAMLYNWNYCYVDSIDLSNKEIEICDIESLEDLEDIKNNIYPWTISNYNDLKEELEEIEAENKETIEQEETRKLCYELSELVSKEELIKLIEKYGKEKTS